MFSTARMVSPVIIALVSHIPNVIVVTRRRLFALKWRPCVSKFEHGQAQAMGMDPVVSSPLGVDDDIKGNQTSLDSLGSAR
jgi:hypothetical protein